MLLEKLLLRNKYTVALFSLLVISGTAMLSAGEVGGLSGAYLRPAVGAAALAMGGASSASPDYLACWWNPAMIAPSKEKKIELGTGTRSLGRTDLFGQFTFKVPPRLGMGFLVLYRGDPFLDNLYNDDYDDPQKLKRASYTTITSKIALSYNFSKKVYAGVNIGILYQRLPTAIDDNGDWIYSSSTGIGSIDAAVLYKINERLKLSVVARDFFSLMTWDIVSDYNNYQINDRPLPSLVLASSYEDSLFGKPFKWTVDLKGYMFDNEWNALDHQEAYLSTGVQLQNWDAFALRLGIGDIRINGQFMDDEYRDEFFCKIGAGISMDLSALVKGLQANYGVSTDKIWAGIDQQLDFSFRF
jgi:hypothetical protein